METITVEISKLPLFSSETDFGHAVHHQEWINATNKKQDAVGGLMAFSGTEEVRIRCIELALVAVRDQVGRSAPAITDVLATAKEFEKYVVAPEEGST